MNFLFSSKKPSKDLIKKYEQMGFDKETTKRAWKACKGDEKKILDHMISLNQPKQVVVTQEPIIPVVIENKSIVKSKSKPEEPSFIKERPAVKAPSVSFKPQPTMKTTYEPMNAEQRIRPDGLPVGLKNVGNTCYVNSLFQAYFMSETFVSSILRYDPRVTLVNDYLTASSAKKEEDDSKRIRIEASIKLIKNLQKLFAKMIKSHKRYIDPTEVLNSVVDDTGQIITVGNQRDITEYHLNFLSRVEDAFFYQDKFLESMREDGGRPIQLKDLPESYTTSATLRNRFQNEASSLSVPENSLITNHFFGRMKQVMTYTVNDEQGMEEKELVVGPIILDVLNKDLYTALEAYCNFTIDDYQAPSGEVTAAKGQIWITKPPELLFVQLNRVSYDKKTNMPVKINQAFEFEKEIFMDRFLLDCRDEAHLINRRIASLKTELAQKESALQKLMTSFESKTDIIHVFSFMENFLKKQIAYEGSPSRTDPDPTLVGMLEEVDKMSIAADIITNYRLHFESKVSELKSSINTIKKTINKLWSKLNKRKYHLVSILIHEGDAESGHYYSFNRNVQRDTWKRFNDHHVSEEKEEVVLTEALGGFGNMSAYCLVYISDENIQEELNLNTTELKDLFAREEIGVDVEKHYYKKLLTPILTQEVIADNISFQDEVEEFQTTSYVKSLVEKYKYRYNMVSKALQTKSSSSPPVHLNSFGYFLKADSYCEGALKWYILDSVLQTSQDSCPIKDIPKLSLKNLKDLPQLFLKLQQQVSSHPKPFNLSSLTLTSQIENQLEIKLAEYNAEYPVLIYTKFILKSFLSENWQEACYATKLFFNIEKSEKSYLFKLVRDCTKVVCLWMALKAENYMKQSQTEEFSNIMLYLTALSKGVLKAEEAHAYQIKTIFLEFLNESQDFITDDDRAVLKDQFQRLSQTSNTIAELDKVVENYESVVNKEDLQRKLKMLSMKDMSNWKDTDENLPSNKLKKLVEKFRFNLQMIVEFHNKISETKTVLNSIDRKRHGFVIL